MHKASLILDAVISKLQTLKSSSVINDLITSRSLITSNHPYLFVSIGPDTPYEIGNAFIDSNLIIYTDVYVQLINNSSLDQAMLAIRLEIHKLIMQDYTLGLDFVIDIEPLGQSDPDEEERGDDFSSQTRLSWQIKYRSNRLDPSL